MIRKKNKVFTFIFSMIFGAGQMYMGFMKQGISLMSVALMIIFIGNWLYIGPILFALPVLWFYCFFDSINKMTLPDELFKDLKDDYLFVRGIDHIEIKKVTEKYNKVIASICIIVGIYILADNFTNYLAMYFPHLYMFVQPFSWIAPRILFAVIIIAIGIKLIIGKKVELDSVPPQIHTASSNNELRLPEEKIIIKENETDENA